jgi:choice-of-anchor B domain-containing protein
MVHIYTRGGDGSYTAAGVLAAPDVRGSRFGTAIVLAGDMALVGAPGEGNGMVHVYRRSNGAWGAAGQLVVDGLTENAAFGSAIAVDGDRVAVGAPGQDGKGAVYTFMQGDGGWTLETTSAIASRRLSDNAQFGASLLLMGDHLIVGAPGNNLVPQLAEQPEESPQRGGFRGRNFGGLGMVAAFDRIAASGAWVERSQILPFDFPTVAGFGSALATVGDELWVGAPMAGGSGEIYRVAMGEGGPAGMTKLSVDSLDRRGAGAGATFAFDGNRALLGMPGDVGGEGTVLFLERAPNGTWQTLAAAFPPTRDRFEMVRGKEVVCEGGDAAEFTCGNTGLLAFLPISQVGGDRGSRMSDNWGWTDPESGREYALAGRNDGTAFVDVTDPENPRYLGNLPLTPGANPAAWRDMKTYRNHAYIVADGAGQHGMQVFDLTRLRNVRTPQTFTPDHLYDNIASAHNIVINEETGYAYSVGTSGPQPCGGGLHMIDIREPKNPTFVGCYADGITGRRGTGYSHDAVCIVYRGPDQQYVGREICVGSNETALSVADVTDKQAVKQVSTASYPFVSYAHQGWFTDDHKYFYLDDESDEIAAQRDTTGQNKAKLGTRTMVYDMTDLDDPVLVKEYIGPVRSSDHNLYVKGNKLYMANYGSGLRIVDISDPVNPREVAFMDTYPDDENQPQMVGAWSTYPYFKSGTILVTSVSEGLFLVKDRSTAVP